MPSHPRWRVSAIVPTFNRADLLSETLVSLFAQTTPPYETIVVDDGSKDDTRSVVAGFGERIRYVRIENSGAPVARNVGAALASGDWLWFCDSDDLWRPTYLERCRAIAATPPYPRFIFGNFRLVKNGEWVGPAKFATAPAGFWEELDQVPAPGGTIFLQPLYGPILTFQPVFHSTIVIAKELFERVGGYDPAFARTGSEDFEFTLRCLANAPSGMVADPLVGIRRHERNFSGDHLRALLGEVEILRHALDHHPGAEQHAATIKAEITTRTAQAIDEAFALNDFEAVRRLAGGLTCPEVGAKRGLKIFLAGLPGAVRDPVVSTARLKNVGRATTR